jgi:hypothetical protein
MKNTQVGNRGKQAYAALKNNTDILLALCGQLNDQGKIKELVVATMAESQIADVLINCISVLSANNQAGAGVFDEATGIYKVFVNAYTSNSNTVEVEVSSISFAYFLDLTAADGTISWTTISAVDNGPFLDALAALISELDLFNEAVGAFAA